MEKPWLDLKMYGLHLFMARDTTGKTSHVLVVAGPGIEKYKDRLSALGFKHDTRFVKQSYWTRPMSGMTHGLIKQQFDRAPLIMMPVEKIIPAIAVRHKAPVKTQQKGSTPETSNVTELTTPRVLPEPAPRRDNDAGNEGNALLVSDGPRDNAEESPSVDGPPERKQRAGIVSQPTANPVAQGGGSVGAPVAQDEPSDRGRGSHATSELESTREDVGSRNTDQRDSEKSGTDEPRGPVEFGGEAQNLTSLNSTEPELDESSQGHADVALSSDIDDSVNISVGIQDDSEVADQAFVDEDELSVPAIDRVWRGITREDIAFNENDYGARVRTWTAMDAFSVLDGAETNGIASLTPREKKQIVAFTGWGGIDQEVRTDNARDSKNFSGKRVAVQLGMDSGRFNEVVAKNRLESYYTPNALTQQVWLAVERAGVPSSGRFFEPGCGAGHFFANAPESVQQHGTLVGVECDPIALRFARVIAPDAIYVESRLESAVLDNNFDAVIGNVPFGESKVFDRRYPKATHVHDYFIVRSLDHLKAGGVMAVLTSSGSMDKASSAIREQMMDRADLVAAFRLPIQVFGNQNASVTTDLLILQKRPPGTRPSYDFTRTVSQQFATGGEPVELNFNQYFHENPDHIIGKQAAVMGAFGYGLQTTTGNGIGTEADVYHKLSELIVENVPEGLVNKSSWVKAEGTNVVANKRISPDLSEISTGFISEYAGFIGDYAINDGKVISILDIVDTFDDEGIHNGKRYLIGDPGYRGDKQELIKAYIGLRDAARQLVTAQMSDDDDLLASAQGTASMLYSEFVEAYGPVNGSAGMLFGDDAGSSEVLALEIWDEDQESVVALSDIFTKRIMRNTTQAVIETAEDAYFVSFDRTGKVDLELMSSLSGIDESEIVQSLNGTLIFQDHQTGLWVSADEYLSGNVVAKLKEVETSLAHSDKFKINYDALLDAQPRLVPFSDIAINLGVNWIPDSDIRDFVSSLVGEKLTEADFKARYNATAGMWTIEVSAGFKREFDAQRTTIYGTSNASFEILLEKLMNGQRPTHTYKDVTGKTQVDGTATQESRGKQDEINNGFYSWVCADPERAERFAEIYNATCNVVRLPNPDGSRITFPGLSETWKPMPHQYNMVARAMMGHNTMAAHPVGAGKTFEMVAIAIKLKQIGMHSKPVIAVPNHMLGQITREAKQMYPGARILMVTNDDLSGNNRKRFLAIARNNDWDMVVCTHSLLNQISAPLDVQLNTLEQQIDVCNAKISETDSRRAERALQARLNTLVSQRLALIEAHEADTERARIISIVDLGIDCMLVDEAHLYKNLALNSSLNVLGITTGGSKRAENMSNLVDYLRDLHGKSFGAFFFTGTPISNSMCEMYVHNRILRPEIMEHIGIGHFDEWAKRFGRVVSNLEALPEGNGFRVNERFAQFVNLPEMIKLFRTFADVKSKTELKLPTPLVNTKIIALEPTVWQQAFMGHLTRRAVAIRNGSVKPDEDNMLSIATGGRKAALDMRLLNPKLPDDSSRKMTAVAKNVYEVYERHSDIKGTQLVFADLGTPNKNKEFSVYQRLKDELMALGMPAKEVVFIHDAKTNDAKEVLFAKVRSGEVRVLIGSTEKMGVGTNVQDRLCALHNVDCPWRPSDIEQRIGRIARRGNLFFDEVDEYRYTTVGSFDIFSWETNKRKQDFITQALMDPDNCSREASEEMDMGHAEVLAVTTGEPKVREKVMTDDKVAKLLRAKRNWEGDKVNRYSAANRYNRELAFIDTRLSIEAKVLAALPDSKYRVATVRGSVMGVQDADTSWLYAKEVGEAIQSRAPVLEAKLMRSNESRVPLNISVGEIQLSIHMNNLKEVTIRGMIGDQELPTNITNISKNSVVLGRGARDWFAADERIEKLKVDQARLHRSLEILGAVDFDEVWEHEQELEDALMAKDELDKWFSEQNFNKVDNGPDPYLTMLEDYLTDLITEDEDSLLQAHDGKLIEKDLFTDDLANSTEQQVISDVEHRMKVG